MADIISKFYYLEHGREAPKNSEYKDVITTSSIIGYKNYTMRKESKQLSDEAKSTMQKYESYFDYTTNRFGAQCTFSSMGWLDSKERDDAFKEEIASAFQSDGDVIWVAVVSLQDHLTSTEMKLFNEEDYATILNKILPDWFKQMGVDEDNFLWWVDYHVNTDNPHIHFNFLEIEKTKMTRRKKLPMKMIDRFKSKFWSEVFAKKRYLEKAGETAEVGFKKKDLLKRETYQSFKEELLKCDDATFIKALKSLHQDLPLHGRLQYGSSHMIPYRERLDELVTMLLKTPNVLEKYDSFQKALKEFDIVRSQNLKTQYTSVFDQEDKKLRTMLANCILQEYKSVDQEFWRDTYVNDGEGEEGKQSYFLPVAASLIEEKQEDSIFIRIPSTQDYIHLDLKHSMMISERTQFRVVEIFDDQQFEVFDFKQQERNKTYSAKKLAEEYFTDGRSMLEDYQERCEDKEMWEQRRKEWTDHSCDWKQKHTNLKKASFSWIHKIEHEVDMARDEYLYGKELNA